MFLINNEKNLKKEKNFFFTNHLDFIREYMPETIQSYVSAFLNNAPLPSLNIQDIDTKPIGLPESDLKLYYCVIYICFRDIGVYWDDFFHYIQPLYPTLNTDFSSSFTFENTTSQQSNLYTIRQCRVDKATYTSDTEINIGFYNKNENFTYHCYDDKQTLSYITQNCSPTALDAYNNIKYPQAKSDFFLIASLYVEGGISADVCSVAQSNLEILIKDTDFLLIYDEDGIHKKFIFAHPQNPFILYHLNDLIQKMDYFGADQNYDYFSSRSAFHYNFMDYYAFNYEYIKDVPITFLHNKFYTAFVHDEICEENLSTSTDFPFATARGAFRQQRISPPLSLPHNIKTSQNNFYMPATKNITIVGHDNCPHFFNRIQTPYTVTSLNVWNVENLYLSGLGWLWKGNKYISLESHLSNLAFNPDVMQNYQRPTSHNITDFIDKECIIVTSAGDSCYGHYLVDDLPRIGLIKDYLGDDFYNKKFIISTFTPEWVKDLLKFFFGLNDSHFLLFNSAKDIWAIKKVFLSSFPTKENYNFHRYIYDFYKQYNQTDIKPHRLVCFSRSLCDPDRKHQRIFQSREVFEYLALSYGFEVICPETLSIQEQIQLMAETACQIGEHGSAQHSSVFNPHGMVIGTLNPIGDIQIALGRIYNDKNILCYSDEFHWGGLNNEVLYYDIDHEKLVTFFERVIETVQKK